MKFVDNIKNMTQSIKSGFATLAEKSEIELEKSSSIKVNGVTYQGRTIIIEGRRVTIDGSAVTTLDDKTVNLTVEIAGDVKKVETMSGDVAITGNVQDAKTMSGDIRSSGSIAKAETMSGDIISHRH